MTHLAFIQKNADSLKRTSADGKLEETNQWYAVAKIAGIKMIEHVKSSTIVILYQ